MKSSLLKAPDVANRLGLSLNTTYLLLAQNAIPSLRIGDGPKARYRVDPNVLERWIASRQSAPEPSMFIARPRSRKDECAALGIDELHEFVN